VADETSFGRWLQRRRKALDLTQEELAQRVGCASETVRKFEADARRPSRQIAERLAEALEIPESDRTIFINAARHELALDRLKHPTQDLPQVALVPAKTLSSDAVSFLFTQITPALQTKLFDGRCPYKGLDVFEEEDADLFFGRDTVVEELIRRVKESRTVFIIGPSGCGKSSLVRAGLIHALRQGTIKNLHSEAWLYGTMKPGRDPIGELAMMVSGLAQTTNAGDEVRANALMDEGILARWCEIALKEGRSKRAVLFIDQFEEIFTQVSNEEERLKFFNLLTHAATTENGRVIILFAMRSDFVMNCAAYPKLNSLFNRQSIQIGAMKSNELVNAIARPALNVGLRIEQDLVKQIIYDMQGESGALPLMQFALKDIFDSQQTNGRPMDLTKNDYLDHGGIHKSLERHADDSFAKLSDSEQILARSIFSGLIEIGHGTQDTRRTALFDELIPSRSKAADVKFLIQKLADARLITTDEKAGKDTVTISHEKLIDAWPWLRNLVDQNRDLIALQNEIANDAKEWDENERDNSYLYSGARLATAQEKIKNLVLSENAQDYLAASIKAEKDSRLQSERTGRRIIIGLISLLTMILGLLIFSLLQLNSSRAQQLGLQAQAALAEENYQTALVYAYQSNKIHKNDAANLVLGQIVYKNFAGAVQLNGHKESVSSIAWSADGRLASGSWDNTIIIWDLETGQPAQTLQGHTDPVISIAWSADGRLASGSRDNTVIIWDLKTGQPSQTLHGRREGQVYSLAWSADRRLASGSDDNSVIIWDLETDQPTQTLHGHTDPVISLAWSTDGRLASGSRDNTVIVWDLETGQRAQTLEGQRGPFYSLAWSTDGRLASGSWDNTVIVWDLNTGLPDQTLQGQKEGPVYSVAWSADGRLASGSNDNTVIVWDLNTNLPAQTLHGHTDPVIGLAWSANGRLASGSRDNTVIVWDLKTDQPAQTLKGQKEGPINSIAWSADGHLASGSEDNTVIVWDLKTDQPAQTLPGHRGPVYSIAWSADGRLASGSEDNTVIVWDLKTGQPAQTLQGERGPFYSVAWSADGRLASGSWDNTVIVWNLKTGVPAQTLQGHTGPVYSLTWSADGHLASSSWDNTVIVWDLETGQLAQTLQGHTGPVYSLAWSADGRLASGSDDNTVIVWDLKTGQPSQTLQGHTGPVYSLAWSADGRLASSSDDNTVIIWDLKTSQPSQTLHGHTGPIYSIAWSADGRLASSSRDNTIKIARADLIGGELCDKIIRNLTIDEWLSLQGALYIYQPTCPNLPLPAFNPINDLLRGNIQSVIITWMGRALLLGILLLFLLSLLGISLVLRKLVASVWGNRRARSKQGPNIA